MRDDPPRGSNPLGALAGLIGLLALCFVVGLLGQAVLTATMRATAPAPPIADELPPPPPLPSATLALPTASAAPSATAAPTEAATATRRPSPTPRPSPTESATTADNGASYRVQEGDTFFSIAREAGLTVQELQALNPDVVPEQLVPGDLLALPPGGATPEADGGVRYVVQEGDTLSSIALAFDLSVEAIIAANPTIDPNVIEIGDVLFIPTE